MKTKRKTANLSVVVKGANGNDPLPTNPMYVRISGTVRPITVAKAWKNAGTKLFRAKQKRDAYGDDSPLYIELGEVRPVIDKWLTRDLTDPDYQYKITEAARKHLVRDVCHLIYRKRLMLARQSLQIQTTTSMKPAKKAGAKVKKVNPLKKATTAKSKKLLKAKKK